jgi:hypothetical protein
MAKRLTRADRYTLMELVERYTPMLIAREALKMPPKKPGRPKEDWMTSMFNAFAVYAAVEARRDGQKGELKRAYEQVANVLVYDSGGRPNLSADKVGKLHASVRRLIEKGGEDGRLTAQLCDEERKLQARSTRVIGGPAGPKAVCLVDEEWIKHPRDYEKEILKTPSPKILP